MMKRKTTKIITALALIAFMMPGLAGWGQTRDVQELTNENIVAAGDANSGYASWEITDDNNHTWNAYAIKNKHSNATSGFHYLQIKKYASNTAYYIQVPELGTQITSITMTVSSTSQPMTGGGNSATLFFSNSNSTSSAGTGVASGTGASSVTIDCSSLNLNTGYITAGGAVRIWDVTVTYNDTPITPTIVTIDASGITNTDVYTSTTAGTLTATVKDNEDTPISDATVAWSSSNENVATIDESGSVTLVAAGVTTITADYAGLEGQYRPSSATYEFTVTDSAPVLDYATLPFAFYGGRADIATTSGLSYYGLGTDYANSPKLKFDNTGDWLILHFLEQPGNLSYDIRGNNFNGSTFKVQVSADGETYTDFVTYTNLPTTNEDPMHVSINNLAADVRYIKWVYAEKVGGNVALGNIELAVYEAPRPYTLSIENSDTYALLAQGITNGHSTTVYGGTLVTVEVRLGDDYVLDEVVVLDTTNQQVTLTQVSTNKWSFYMPNSNVMISAIVVASHAPAYYNLATSIESGKKYIIVGKKNGVYYAMGAQKTNSNNVGTNRAAKPIAVEGNTASVTRSDVYDFVINLESEGLYSFYDVNAQGYLYTPTASSNTLMTEDVLDENGKWTISFDSETGAARVVANGKKMQFNANSILFSCYASGSQDSIYLYKIDDTFTFDITGYTGAKDHYYLIASPVTVDPENVDGMTEGDFDLYYFDQTGGGESGDGKEWRNYKANHFNLVPGKGYLYAKKATDGHSTYSFSLTGDLYTGDGVINLEPGWNLIGNPFRQLTELDIEDYYVINETGQGSELIAGDVWQVQPMEGIFVYGDDDVSSVTFSRISSGSKSAGLTLNLSRGSSVESTHHGVIDRAIVRFGEGQQLPKFQLDENSTKVFISQDNKDYAVVRSAKEGEMPVCFKAEQNGTYTLSMNAKEMSFDYLHLVDNMTGMDIDLLQTPCYTFEAHTNDYTSRFRLIFSANDGDSEGNETFSYFNGSEWIISNDGDAVLEVVDITGRVVRSESINGDAAISINETAGVYLLRLINGDNVKTQKVIVR